MWSVVERAGTSLDWISDGMSLGNTHTYEDFVEVLGNLSVVTHMVYESQLALVVHQEDLFAITRDLCKLFAIWKPSAIEVICDGVMSQTPSW